MSPPEPTVLESFHRFIGQQLQTDAAIGMSPEQALAMWREHQESAAAIREGLADIEAGRTRSLDEFDDAFRTRHGIESSK